MPKFHIQNVNHPCGSSHNRIVEYANVKNVIRFALPKMPPGQYEIHELNPKNIHADPVRTTPAYRRAR